MRTLKTVFIILDIAFVISVFFAGGIIFTIACYPNPEVTPTVRENRTVEWQFPDKVTFGGVEYGVEFVDEIEGEVWAKLWADERVLRVKKDLPPEIAFEVYLHEISHIARYHSIPSDLFTTKQEEAIAKTWSKNLEAILIQNGLFNCYSNL